MRVAAVQLEARVADAALPPDGEASKPLRTLASRHRALVGAPSYVGGLDDGVIES